MIGDTLSIYGGSFRPGGKAGEGFLPGKYRLRVTFNPDKWKPSELNRSGWVEFESD